MAESRRRDEISIWLSEFWRVIAGEGDNALDADDGPEEGVGEIGLSQ